ncbi:hypothetical protein VNI00_018073 [Paramarasmius palmivorus]|uniref:Uncharacterized protein n=1 Tax=Paramarasmius palmivorus TaxID=297713 RepID=A0AAW0B0J9_9AGAR
MSTRFEFTAPATNFTGSDVGERIPVSCYACSQNSEKQDLISRYEKIIASKEEAIKKLTGLLSQLNMASSNHSAKMGARMIPAGNSAIPCMFATEDWESKLDGTTQLMFSAISLATGLRIIGVNVIAESPEGIAEYEVRCMLSAAGRDGIQDTFCHHFKLFFRFRVMEDRNPGGYSCGMQRVVDYDPYRLDELKIPMTQRVTRYCVSSSIPLESLCYFFFDMASAFSSAAADKI